MITGATGAPREQERTIAVGLRLTQLLTEIGVESYRDDAFDDNDPKVNDTDWDLYLSLHCDANYAGDEGGGFVDWIDPSIDSSVTSNKESKRIKEAIEAVYFNETGIKNVPGRSNPNTKFYYMWNVLSPKTPCVIIEMGESIDPHDNVILNDTERVAKALLKSIQNAFPDLIPVTPPTPPVDNCQSFKDQISILTNTINANNVTINNLNSQINQLEKDKNMLADELKVCQLSNLSTSELNDKLIQVTQELNQIRLDLEQSRSNWSLKEVAYNKQISLLTTKYNATKSSLKKLLIDYIFGKTI